jgi:hypothetical protein
VNSPVLEGDHRAALRLLAYAVLADALVKASERLRVRRTFVLSFPEDDGDAIDETWPGDSLITVRMPVLAMTLADDAAR